MTQHIDINCPECIESGFGQRAHPRLEGCDEWLRKQMDKQREKEKATMTAVVQGVRG